MTRQQQSELVESVCREAKRIARLDPEKPDVGQIIEARINLGNAAEYLRCELAEQIDGPSTAEEWEEFCGVKLEW